MHRVSTPNHAMNAICMLILVALLQVDTVAQFDPLKRKAARELRQLEQKKDQPKENENGGDAAQVIRDASMAVNPLLDIRSGYKGMFQTRNLGQQFYDMCRKADYPAWRTKVEQAVRDDPKGKEMNEMTYDDVMTKLPEQFAKVTKDALIPEINAAIEKAYAEKSRGASRAGAASDAADGALLAAEGILLVTPDNADVQRLREDAKAAVAGMQAGKDAVYSGAFNKEHAGQIVFSTEPIAVNAENPSALKTSFSAKDNIFGMMYFSGTFGELTGESNVASTHMLVDGTDKVFYDFKLPADQAGNAWLKSEVLPDPARSTTKGALVFTKAISELSPRKHEILIRTVDSYGKTLAEGGFQLDCTTGLDRVAELHRALNEKKLSAVTLPAAAKRDPALEKECLAAVRNWKETPLKVIITDPDWTIQRHPLSGAITSRTINTTVAFTLPTGGCRMFSISFRQQYNGSKYGKAEQYGVGDSADIPCDNVK